MFRKLTETGAITVPAEMRGEEDGYIVRENDGELVLIPAKEDAQPIN